MHSLRTLTLLALLLTGCSGAALQSSLVGKWRGKPETSVARGGREQARLVALHQAAGMKAEGAAEKPLPLPPTDLEQFDFEIAMDLARDGTATMSLGSEEGRTGTWRIIATDPNGATLELALPEQADADPIRRRFELRFTSEERTQFTLREEGADPQFGRILFEPFK
jgi:hypothetical protein